MPEGMWGTGTSTKPVSLEPCVTRRYALGWDWIKPEAGWTPGPEIVVVVPWIWASALSRRQYSKLCSIDVSTRMLMSALCLTAQRQAGIDARLTLVHADAVTPGIPGGAMCRCFRQRMERSDMVVVGILCGCGFDMVVMVFCVGVKGKRKSWGFGRAL
jgi:hypothetical protein